MKRDTVVLLLKGVCYTIIGGLTPVASSLAQWADSGTWPPTINWIVIGAGGAVGAATQLLSFLSSAYATYNQSRGNGNSGTTLIAKP